MIHKTVYFSVVPGKKIYQQSSEVPGLKPPPPSGESSFPGEKSPGKVPSYRPFLLFSGKYFDYILHYVIYTYISVQVNCILVKRYLIELQFIRNSPHN